MPRAFLVKKSRGEKIRYRKYRLDINCNSEEDREGSETGNSQTEGEHTETKYQEREGTGGRPREKGTLLLPLHYISTGWYNFISDKILQNINFNILYSCTFSFLIKVIFLIVF